MNNTTTARDYVSTNVIGHIEEEAFQESLWEKKGYSLYEIMVNVFDENNEDEGEYKEIISLVHIKEEMYNDLKNEGYAVAHIEDVTLSGIYYDNIYIWGRETFGQLIEADSVIENIVEKKNA